MEFMRINDTEYLQGIKWSSIIPRNEVSKRFAQLSNAQKAKIGIVCHYKNNAVIGLLEEATKKPKQLSAAVYLANANGLEYTQSLQEGQEEKGLAWICVQKVGSEKYWVGNALNGLPFEEDVVVSSQEVKNIVGNLLTNVKLEAPNSITTIFIEDENLNTSLNREFNSEENVSFSSKDFEDLIVDVKYQAQIKERASIAKALMVLVGLGILGGVAYFTMEWLDSLSAEDEARMSEEYAQQQKEKLSRALQEYESKKAEIIQATKEKVKQDMNNRLTSPTETSILNNWYDTLAKESLVIRGWTKTDINCGINTTTNKTFCDVNLTRSNTGNIGTVKYIKDYYANKGISDIVIDEKGDKAIVKYINDNDLEIERSDYSSLNDFDLEAFKYKTISELQLLGLNNIVKDFKKPTLITTKIDLPSPPEGIRQDFNFEELNLGIAQGEITLQGNELYKLKALANNLNRLEKPIYIKSVEVKAMPEGSNYTWILKGDYFVEDKDHKGGNIDKIEIPKSEIIYK